MIKKGMLFLLVLCSLPLVSSEEMDTEHKVLGKRKRDIEILPTNKKRKKDFTVGIIGATGHVGESTSFLVQDKNVANKLVLWGRNSALCSGIAEDLKDVANIPVYAETDLKQIAPVDLIFITVGETVTKDQSRDELFEANMKMIKNIITELSSAQQKNDNAVIVIVTNPVEDLTYYTLSLCQQLGYLKNPESQVIGTGTLLDQLRALNISGLRNHNITVLGEHGDQLFIPWSHTNNTNHLSASDKEDIAKKTKHRSYVIVATKGYTQYGIAHCLVDICKAVQSGKTLPVSVWNPKYKAVLSQPTLLGITGIKSILPLTLNSQEEKQLQTCITKRKKMLGIMSKELSL